MFIDKYIEKYNLSDKIYKELYDTKNINKEQLMGLIPIGYTNRTYRIYLKQNLRDDTEVGFTNYQEAKIFIKLLDLDMMHRTLIHELTHAWMFENGHNQAERSFNHEDVCEINACIFDFIYDALDIFYDNFFKNKREETN